MADGITSGAILKRTAEIVRGNAAMALAALAALVALAVGMDMAMGPDGTGNLFVTGLATVLAQYLITRTVMEKRSLQAPSGYRAAGFAAVFGVCVLSNIGIILGFVLLIVPGVYLAIRWFAAVPALFGEQVDVTGALGESWEKTKGHGSAIFGALVVVYLPLIVAILMAFVIGFTMADGGDDPSGSLAFSLMLNMLTSVAAVVGWHAAIAFWELRTPAASALADVFA